MCTTVHREFSYESPGEKNLKIGPHLQKLLSNTKQLTFLEHGIDSVKSPLFIQARHKHRDRQTDGQTEK